jgi:hypothetical protein
VEGLEPGERSVLDYLDERRDVEKCGKTGRVAQSCLRKNDLYKISSEGL